MKFKRLSILLTLMLAFSTFFTSFAFADENTEKPNLVALGDSITFGYKLEDTQTQASPNAFPNLIGDFNVTNLGVPGWTSTHVKTALETNPAFTAAIKSANVITLDIGSNDLLAAANINELIATNTPADPSVLLPKYIEAAALLADNLEFILTKIRTENPEAPIILYNIYNPFGESTDPFFGYLHTIGEKIVNEGFGEVPNMGVIPGINNLYDNYGQFPGIYLADAYSAFDGHQAEFIFGAPKDLIHPNAEGHQALAGLAREILISLLPEVPEVPVVELSAPTEQTEGPVTITVNTNAEEVDSLRWLEGEKSADDFYAEDGSPLGTNIEGNKFEVTKNGSYSVYLLDVFGNEVVQIIKIENIKQPELPVENPTPTPTPKPTTPAKPAVPSTGTGHPLPNTASPAYNFVGAGAIVLLAGFAALKIQQRRRRNFN